MSIKYLVLLAMLAVSLLAVPVSAVSNITSAKDLIGNPVSTFNGLPDSVKNGIWLVTGLIFLGCLIAVVYGVFISVGKSAYGATSQDAKMRNEGVSGIITIAGVVLVAMIVLGFVFWYMTSANL